MLKNIMKRTLSSFLALTMVVTTVCFFDLSGLFPTAGAAIASTSYTVPDAYIVVPETFYIRPAPVWNDSSAKTVLLDIDFSSVQYYVNNTLSGSSISTEEVRDASTGKIWFSVPGATVTDLHYSILGTNKQDVSLNAGTSYTELSNVTLSSSMSAASTRTLEWVFTCKINGRPAEYHAYTVAYAPYYKPVGVVMDHRNTRGQESSLQGLAWISGLHSFSDTTNFSKHYPRVQYDSNGWFCPMVPLLEPVRAPIDEGQDSFDWFTTDSSTFSNEQTFSEYDSDGRCDLTWYGGGDSYNEMRLTSQTGNLTVDISRNSNFNTIPNVTTGAMISDRTDSEDIGSFGFYMSNYNSTPPSNATTYTRDGKPNPCYYDDVGTVFAGTSGWDNRPYTTTKQKLYDNVWPCATPAQTGSTTKYIHMAACGERSSDWIFLNGYLKVDVTAVDKSALRTAVFNKQKQANAAALSNYSVLSSKLKDAYAALGDPTASQAAVNEAKTALDSAAAGIAAQKTTVVRHVNARTGELMPDSNSYETLTTNLGDEVTVSPNTYTGYTLTGKTATGEASSFYLSKWNSSSSSQNGGNNSVASKTYDAATDTLTMVVTGSDVHTADTRSATGDVRTSGFDYFAVDPNETYALSYEYAGTGNGDVGVHCYDKDGKYLGVAWLHTLNYSGLMAATGSAAAFRSETFYFCAANYTRPSSSYLAPDKRAQTRYISLCFGGYPNDGSHGTPNAAATPLTCAFRNVTWTPTHTMFDMDKWAASSSGVAGTNQSSLTFEPKTKTLTIVSTANDTYSAALRTNATDIRTSGYDYFEVDPNETYTLSYDYAGNCNGMIGFCYYDADGQYLGAVWRYANVGLMANTGSPSTFISESYDICFMRNTDIDNYISQANRSKVRYVSLSFGNYPNNVSSSVTTVFRNVHWAPKAAKTNLFDAAAWASSDNANLGAGGTTRGVSSISYDMPTDTVTVVNSGNDTYTPYKNGNILTGEYNFIPVDPDGTYTLDFDYASETRAEIGVICYDDRGERIGNVWYFDSLKASGSANTFRHHTEVICPQTSQYLSGNANRFKVHYIALTFGNYAESGQSAATCKFRNVSVTANNELFDMTQWAFRSANRYKDGNLALTAADLSYDSETKTLTVSSSAADTISAYPDSIDLFTDSVTVGSSSYPFYYTPVQSNTSYTFELEYAGTGNGDLGVLEYDADGNILTPKTWCHTLNSAHDILDKTGSDTDFEYYTTTITTKANTRYIVLAFGGYPNSGVSYPVTSVFRNVRMHLTNSLSVPYADSEYTFYYRPNVYYVDFDGNGSSSGSMDTQRFTYDQPQALNANAYAYAYTVSYDAHGGDLTPTTAANTNASAAFDGWATTPSGNVAFNDQGTVSSPLTTTDFGSVTLYAKWDAGSVTLAQATRGGYTLDGWYTSETGGTNVGVSGDSYTPSSNITLHARWISNSFRLTFDNSDVGPDGNMPPDMTLYYNTASDPLPAPYSPWIDGWEFLGWTDETGGSGIGDDEENISLNVSGPRRTAGAGDGESSTIPTVKYYAGDVIDAQTVNSFYAEVGAGEAYTLYAVWKKTLTATFTDYNSGVERTREETVDVYNGDDGTISTETIAQGTHSGWTRAGWTTLRQKGASGSALPSEIEMDSDDNLFDIDTWYASPSGTNGGSQTMTYTADSETLTSVGTTRDVMSRYNSSNLLTENFNRIEVNPYKTYTLGVDYAASANVSGQIGVHFYDASGNSLATCWLFQGTSSANGDPHRGGDHFGQSTGLTDFKHEDIEICPMDFESSYLGSFTEAQRASVKYIVLSFGNYSDGSVSSGNPSTVIYRNVTFTENVAYYGVYRQAVSLSYDQNLTGTVQNMPTNPAAQNRVANSALGFGTNDVQNPSFTLSSAELTTTGYTYQGWNTDPDATTGTSGGFVTLSASTTYYAIWTANNFYIAFDKNGVGTDANMPAAITASYNTATANLPAPTATTVDGWTFMGWAVPGALTTVAYASNTPISAANTIGLYDAAGGEGETYTLYAVWQKTITATFIDYMNGAQRTTTVSEVVYNGASASIASSRIPAQGTHDGWTSAGWTTSQLKGATGSAVSDLTLNADVTYYGVYTKSITILYDPNTDDTSVAGMPASATSQTRYANSYLGFAAANTQNPTFTVSTAQPTRTGYQFLGWTDVQGGASANTSGSIELTETKTLYAVWQLSEYKLTVHAAVGGSVGGRFISGSGFSNISVAAQGSQEYTVLFNYLVFDLVPTAAAGYTFSGWTTTGSLTLSSADSTSASLSFNMPAGDASLTANFTPNPYTITYNHGDGATGNAQVQDCTYDQNVTLYTNGTTAAATVTAFAKTGYTFSCWNAASDGSGSTDYAAGATLTAPNFATSGNFNLYAKWVQNSYTITYALVNGTHGSHHPNSATFDEAFYVSAPTKNGYDFDGWTVSSGLDSSTAKWGSSSDPQTALTSAQTHCKNGATGDVYFLNLSSTDGASVTLAAQWTPKNYHLLFDSNKNDSVTYDAGSKAYDAQITMPDETVLNHAYPGYSFLHWVSSSDGVQYAANSTFTLAGTTYEGNETVVMTAQWAANSYRIVYDLNGSSYAVSDLAYIVDPDVGAWNWKTAESDLLSMDSPDATVTLHGAYSDEGTGIGSCFYLNKPDEVRFGLGWAYTATTSTDNMIPFAQVTSIDDIPAAVLQSATPVAGETHVFEIRLYMVWSANYKPLENKLSEFQSTYMTFAQNASTLRGTQYGATDLPVYTDAPTYAMLPAIASIDAAYKAGGVRARELYPNVNDPHHGKYTWVAGGMTSVNTADWIGLNNSDANDFTAGSLNVVNNNYRDILEQVIMDPCNQYNANTSQGKILPQSSQTVLTQSVNRLDEALNASNISAGTGYLLNALRLKDVDLDYRLSDTEMAAFNVDSNDDGVPDNGIDFGASCETASGGGISYKPDSETSAFLHDAFGETLSGMYPPCETVVRADNEQGHHSFNDLLEAGNSVLGRANAIFAQFGFDPTQTRNPSANYFTSGNTDSNGFTINNNCIYTTESVYRLFDLIYGQDSGNGTYESAMLDSINSGNVALYYQVKDSLGSGARTILRKPSQEKLNRIVTMMVYGYHSLELKNADYSEFAGLFEEYFWATWGTALQSAGYSKSNMLTTYQGFFTTESYNALAAYMEDYFSAPEQLMPNGDGARNAVTNKRTTFPYYKIVEQNKVNGQNPIDGNVRTYGNVSVDENDVDLTAFQYADGTLCAEYCDLIDALVPAPANYNSIFQVIAGNARRVYDSNTFTVDPREYPDDTARAAFYPSTYANWYALYANENAWEGTVEIDPETHETKPLFDTNWLYHYYTEDSVNALRYVLYGNEDGTIEGIDWQLDKMHQVEINTTIRAAVQQKFNELTPKSYAFYFYYGLPNNNSKFIDIDDYDSNGVDMPYRFGMTFVSPALTPDASLSSGKTFYGWFTKRNDTTHCVSDPGNIYIVNLPIDETLLDTWVNAGKAEVSSEDGVVYKVNLYGGWVENVTLEVDLDGGSATMTPTDENGAVKTAVSVTDTASPTYNYGWTLTFSGMAKTGYTFNGWNFQMGSSNQESSMVGNVYTFGYYTGSTKTNDTLAAVWTPITYTVTYHANAADATGTMAPQTLTYDSQATLTPNAFSRTGYVFDYWTTDAAGNGTQFDDEDTVLNLASVQDGNVDLYVRWKVADFTLTFNAAANGGTWQGWQAATSNTDTLTKTIRYQETFGTAITDGKTWPNDPIKAVTVADGITIYAAFEGWYTQDGTTPVVASTPVNDMGNVELFARFENVNMPAVKTQIQTVLEEMDANHYTLDSMQAVDQAIGDILAIDPSVGITQADKAALDAAVAALEPANNAADGDTTAPVMTVYENKKVLSDAVESGAFVGDTSYILDENSTAGEISFVYPGKCYYTYHCYTNSTSPAIMLNANDVAGTSRRVSYPTTFSGTNVSGIVNSGWMNYTYDSAENNLTGRNADYVIMNRSVDNPYQNDLEYFGRDFSKGIYKDSDDDGYEFYTHEQYVLLKPQFVAGGGKQFALYTFEVRDDSYNNVQNVNGDLVASGLPGNRAKLAGAENFGEYATVGADLSTSPYEPVTPVNTVTIYVEYNNTMYDGRSDAGGQAATNGVGTAGSTGALEVYNGFHENGYDNNKWVNVDYLYRNAAGAANSDFIYPQSITNGSYELYVANDPVFGQNDFGSFYYLMHRDDPAVSAYWNAYDDYLAKNENDLHGARVAGANAALGLAEEKVIEDMKDDAVRSKTDNTWTQAAEVQNGDYVYWPYTGSTRWSTQFYAAARTREDTLVFVHVYDRWGNHYTNILQRDIQDTKEAVAAMLSRGNVVVNELGGSGIQNITISELNSQKPVGVSGMTDDDEWNVVNNQFTITGLPQGNNNYRYTMTITDNAGSEHVSNFQAASDGSVIVTVNDENMGDSYAAAASAPAPQSVSSGAVDGIGIGEIDESPLTTMAVEEVQPDVIAVNTIEEARINGSSDEEGRPDLYSFSLNEIYTVNLFADATRDYAMTLKSTAGGIVKAYVNGTFAPAKAGKVTIPSGSQVQIRVSSRAGYMLTDLTMEYADGRMIDLVGAYNAEINDDVIVRAFFAETDDLLTVQVENGKVSAKHMLQVKPYSRVTAVAEQAPDGKVFAFWSQDGADDVPVSYDEIYTFIVTSDVRLKANYADAPAEQVAAVAMDAANPTHVSVVNGMYTLSYSGKITVPDGAQIEEFGLVLTNQDGESCSDGDLRIGGKVNGVNVAKLTGQTLTEEGQCKINVNNVKGGQTRTGRLYLIVRMADGSSQTIYSSTWSELNTPEG